MQPYRKLTEQAGPPGLEAAARASLNQAVGRPLTNGEWARARHNLLEFAQILRAWEQRARENQQESGAFEQSKAA